MNFIKEFFKKRKEKKTQQQVSNYGDISIECIYHDHFIKIMNAFILLASNKPMSSNSEVYSTETTTKTSFGKESITLNSSNNIFKDSVLCAISEKVKAYEDTLKNTGHLPEVGIPHILDLSNIIIKLSIDAFSEAVIDVLLIYRALHSFIDVNIKYDKEKRTIEYILSGSARWFLVFRDTLIEDGLLNDNIIANKLVDYINSIIPEEGTKYGNMYFTGLEDHVYSIKPYSILKSVQVLSHDNLITENNILSDYISNKDNIYSMQHLYLVIDNPVSEIIKAFNTCDIFYKVTGINRYIIRINYYSADLLIDSLADMKLEETLNCTLRDNIISTIRCAIPCEALDRNRQEQDEDLYANVDEIIE